MCHFSGALILVDRSNRFNGADNIFRLASLIWVIIGIVAIATEVKGDANKDDTTCNLRKFGQDNDVDNLACVCNVDYCDKLQFNWPLRNDVLVVRTTMAGLRFHKTFTSDGKRQFDERPILNERDYKQIDLNVDTSDKYQEIFGFGGALSDSASFNIQSLKYPLNRSLMEDYFNSATGLEYNFIRVPLGGADFSVRPYTYADDIEEDFDLKHFELAYEDEHLKIPLIKVANEEAYPKDVRVIGSAWTAPRWMKTNDNLVKGTLKGKPGGPYYKAYANYMLKSYEEYKKRNVTLWGITVQNEPIHPLNPSVNFNSMIMRPEDHRDFIKFDLGPLLDEKNLSVSTAKNKNDKLELMILDDNLILAEHYLKIVLADKEVYKYTTGIAIHWYYNYAVPHHVLTTIKRRYPDKFILSTEASEGYLPIRGLPVELGSWRRGVTYALDIIKDLKFHVNGWIDWNLALDTKGGPNWAKNHVDSLVIVNTTAQEYYKNPGFYIMGHVSKFLPRGSRIIGTALSGQGEYSQLYDDFILTLGALTPSNHLVIIVLNNHMKPIELTINVDKRFKIPVRLDENSITTIVTTNYWL